MLLTDLWYGDFACKHDICLAKVACIVGSSYSDSAIEMTTVGETDL